jgi:molybdenum cofactor cytidylyltransferase
VNSETHSVGAVLLAAGSGRRFGAAKQIVLVDGLPMVRRTAMAAINADLAPVIVVIGAHGDTVRPCLAGLPVHIAENLDWASGMGGSLALGVRMALTQAPMLPALLVLLADQPGIGAADIRAMVEAYARVPDRIQAARCEDHLGPPCLFPHAYFDELASTAGPYGARGLLERHAAAVDTLELTSAAFDIDTPADLAAWQARDR